MWLFMKKFNAFNNRTYLYLGLHSTYGILWNLKDYIFGDKKFAKKENYLFYMLHLLNGLNMCYGAIPMSLTCANPNDMPLKQISIATFIWGTGVFLMWGADCQKYYTLKYKKGLITEGFFKLCRHPGYTGEIMIYSAYAYVSGHYLSAVALGSFMIPVFAQGIIEKEESLSRYKEWKSYKDKTLCLIPNIFSVFM